MENYRVEKQKPTILTNTNERMKKILQTNIRRDKNMNCEDG